MASDASSALSVHTSRALARADVDTDALVREVQTPSADADLEITVRRIDSAGQYVAELDGQRIADVTYRDTADQVIVLSTFVEPVFRGQGIAGALIGDALDDIRARDKRVRVLCPVVAAFIATNREYADLVQTT